MSNILNRLWFLVGWLQFVTLLSIATYLSLAPDPGETLQSYSDKFLHVFCWFSLSASLYFATRRAKLAWYLPVILLAYSGSIEIIQGLMPPREMSFLDLLSNAAGIILALIVIRIVTPFYQRWFLNPMRKLVGVKL